VDAFGGFAVAVSGSSSGVAFGAAADDVGSVPEVSSSVGLDYVVGLGGGSVVAPMAGGFLGEYLFA
jgi:hypothetical protein